jgi:hypothetical protein
LTIDALPATADLRDQARSSPSRLPFPSRRRHARAKRRFGSMEKNGGVVLGDTQELGHVLPGSLVENAQRDHGALNFAKLRHAGSQPQPFHRTPHQLVRKSHFGVRQLQSVDFVVRASSKVSPTLIARGVTDDRRQDWPGIAPGLELTCSYQVDQGAKAFLNAIDGVAPLDLRSLQQPFEYVLVDWSRCHQRRLVRS